jgi:hypothetical protein
MMGIYNNVTSVHVTDDGYIREDDEIIKHKCIKEMIMETQVECEM